MPPRRHQWGRWTPGEPKPAWWPRNEPFPPTDWPRMRARFMTRMAAFAFMAFVFFSFFVWLVVSVVTGIASAVTGGSPNPFVVIGAIFLVFFVFFGARGAGRIARPVGDLIEAAEHVERGDYTTRLRARGPREVRKLANAFNAMSARLERSEAERRRLLADVTHELRTPLTVIQGNVEALIDGVHPADETHLRAILDETQVLSRLVDDLRTVSVAEAGALALHREMTDVASLARDVVASFTTAARARGVDLVTDVPATASADVDPIRVREVLTNIVANALRYTPSEGRVRVTVTRTEREVAVAVRDTGPGIDADMLPHIFERFTRSPESPGAGLGLAIAKSLVNAHGGDITAASAPGSGTEIRFTLPVTAG
jgi:two-component system OmpR family sensor kinase/two-component system sensor histidine kinase BaeS